MSGNAPHLPAAPDRARLKEAPRSAPYLKSIKMVGFGAFRDKVVGPFSPHLNVVFGRNEAGKSTVSAFVKGVLFGWEEARARATPTVPPTPSEPARSSSPNPAKSRAVPLRKPLRRGNGSSRASATATGYRGTRRLSRI